MLAPYMAAAVIVALLVGALPFAWLWRRSRRRLAELQDEHARCKAQIESLQEDLAARARALESMQQDLDGLSYSVSHDLSAPLRSIAGFGDLLGEEAASMSDQGREWLERLRYNAQRMNSMIADLLRYSRIGRAEMHIQPVDLNAVAAEAVRAAGSAHPQTSVELAPLPTLPCDPKLIREVFHIYAANAFKFSARSAAPRIEVGSATDAGEACIFVRDNGTGFNMRYAEKLFGAFQRLHKESDFPGNGIGLAIAKKIVQRHGGRVWAQAVPGEGATFYFSLGSRSGQA